MPTSTRSRIKASTSLVAPAHPELIAARKAALQAQGPVLVLDDGDYSIGTAFGAAIRETGAEL
jgi:hypothetical protein